MGRPSKLDPDLIWRTILEIGNDWTIQSVTDRLREVTGVDVSRAAVSKRIKQHELKEKWVELQRVSEVTTSPEVKELIATAAKRVRLEDLESSVLALETYNGAIIAAAQHVIDNIALVKIEKISDASSLISVLARAFEVSGENRKAMADLLTMVGGAQGEGGKANATAVPSTVVSIKDKMKALRQ